MISKIIKTKSKEEIFLVDSCKATRELFYDVTNDWIIERRINKKFLEDQGGFI